MHHARTKAESSDMEKIKIAFEDLLKVRTRFEALSLPQAQRLAAHAASLEPGAPALRLAVVHTYTSDLLDPWLSLAGALQGLRVETYHAPYGLALQEATASSQLMAHSPDLTVFLLQRVQASLHYGGSV